jgi:apolipoprotein N-acyltransferase
MQALLSRYCVSIALGLGMLSVGSTFGVLMGWCTAICLLYMAHDERTTYRSAFLNGLLANMVGLFWVWPAAQSISGQNIFVVTILFTAFCAYHALQLPAFLFVFRALPHWLDRYVLRASLAWVSVECLPLRFFPWRIGHSQWAFTTFIQIAELGGIILITLLMMWLSDAIFIKRRLKAMLIPGLAFSLSLIFGLTRINHFSDWKFENISVAMIQAAESPSQSTDERLDKLKTLTESLPTTPDLIIWPEGSLPFKVHESISHARYDARLPRFFNHSHFLLGTKTYRRPNKTFNSALFIERGGNIPLPYHKQRPIPFGEYIPFEKQLPILRFINPNLEALSAGTEHSILNAHLPSRDVKAQIAPLICYEDLFPSFGIQAARKGADLIVSLSDDSWAGNTGETALWQHYMLSAFRSVELRRSFLRTTSTGVTSFTSPLGELVSFLPPRTDGVMTATAPLVNYQTYYVAIGGDLLWYVIAAFSFFAILCRSAASLRLSTRFETGWQPTDQRAV